MSSQKMQLQAGKSTYEPLIEIWGSIYLNDIDYSIPDLRGHQLDLFVPPALHHSQQNKENKKNEKYELTKINQQHNPDNDKDNDNEKNNRKQHIPTHLNTKNNQPMYIINNTTHENIIATNKQMLRKEFINFLLTYITDTSLMYEEKKNNWHIE